MEIRRKDVEKSGMSFKELMNIVSGRMFQGIIEKKHMGGFEFIRTNVQLNVQIDEGLSENNSVFD